jgi:hypothetical protein
VGRLGALLGLLGQDRQMMRRTAHAPAPLPGNAG